MRGGRRRRRNFLPLLLHPERTHCFLRVPTPILVGSSLSLGAHLFGVGRQPGWGCPLFLGWRRRRAPAGSLGPISERGAKEGGGGARTFWRDGYEWVFFGADFLVGLDVESATAAKNSSPTPPQSPAILKKPERLSLPVLSLPLSPSNNVVSRPSLSSPSCFRANQPRYTILCAEAEAANRSARTQKKCLRPSLAARRARMEDGRCPYLTACTQGRKEIFPSI